MLPSEHLQIEQLTSLKIDYCFQSSGDEDGDDPLVYSVSEANATADLHGESYARFKQKVLKDLHPELDDEEDDEDSD